MKNELEKRIEKLERELALLKLHTFGNGRSTVDTAKGKKTLSPKEFLISRNPKSDVETTFLLFCYAERFRGSTSSTIADIERLFRESRMPVPTNLNDKVNKNIHKGLLTQAEEKKDGKTAWVVTLTGERSFEEAKTLSAK